MWAQGFLDNDAPCDSLLTWKEWLREHFVKLKRKKIVHSCTQRQMKRSYSQTLFISNRATWPYNLISYDTSHPPSCLLLPGCSDQKLSVTTKFPYPPQSHIERLHIYSLIISTHILVSPFLSWSTFIFSISFFFLFLSSQ